MRGDRTPPILTSSQLVLTLCAIALASVACARGGVPPRSPGVTAVTPAATTIVVRNHHEADLRLYVIVAGGKNYRLGLVPKLGAATLTLPQGIRLPAELSFAAIPMSDADPQVTGPIEVDVGARLMLTVAHASSLSTLSKLP